MSCAPKSAIPWRSSGSRTFATCRGRLTIFGEQKAFVLVFTNTTCPLVQKYWPKLKRLDEEYRDKGVQFVSVNVGADDEIQEIAQQAIDFDVEFPFVKDTDGSCVKALGVQRTPEVVVLDARAEAALSRADRRSVSARRIAARCAAATTWPMRSRKCWPGATPKARRRRRWLPDHAARSPPRPTQPVTFYEHVAAAAAEALPGVSSHRGRRAVFAGDAGRSRQPGRDDRRSRRRPADAAVVSPAADSSPTSAACRHASGQTIAAWVQARHAGGRCSESTAAPHVRRQQVGNRRAGPGDDGAGNAQAAGRGLRRLQVRHPAARLFARHVDFRGRDSAAQSRRRASLQHGLL